MDVQDSFVEDASHKNFVLGTICATVVTFENVKFHFWRMSRRKISFWERSVRRSSLLTMSASSFGGSAARKLRFGNGLCDCRHF